MEEKGRVQFSLNLKVVCIVLLAVIAGMLVVWKPWAGKTIQKTITVAGQATIERAPDEYVFNPHFTASADTSAAATDKATKAGNATITKLKALGVKDDQLATHVDAYNNGATEIEPLATTDGATGTYTATYQITCKVGDKELAQKIADYLATSGATGSITPQANFKEATRNQLDTEAREKAIDDARKKAELEARKLGVKLGKVTSVSEEQFGDVVPLGAPGELKATDATDSSPPVLSGTQPYTFSIKVSFAIR